MSDQVIPRDPLGRVLPGYSLNPGGRVPSDKPRFNRDAIIDVCIKRDYEPIERLIDLSRQPDASPYLQFAIHKEIAEYLYPKRRSVVLGDDAGGGNEIRISWDTPQDGDNTAHTDVPKVRKRRDEQTKEFDRKMRNATATVIDAVLTDDSNDTP